MLLYKEKGDALCKLCLDKKVIKTVYAKMEALKPFRPYKGNTWHRK